MNAVIMPFIDNEEMTVNTMQDIFHQTLPDVQLLWIDNGSRGREWIDRWAAGLSDLHTWHHEPPLPSLSATWNRALRWAWESGAEHCLVVNNDVRLWKGTYEYLVQVLYSTGALFVTATGVTQPQFEAFCVDGILPAVSAQPVYPLPGPDYSCFLITKACHEQYPFDEAYIPAFCEDLDHHRRMMLGGDGQRIFGTGLPFQHIGSGTLRNMTEAQQHHWGEKIIRGSRTHHERKWGGGVNAETFFSPFDQGVEGASTAGLPNPPTTAALFEQIRYAKTPR